MKKLLFFICVCLIVSSGCKKDSNEDKLLVEFSGFSGANYHEVILRDQTNKVIFAGEKRGDNTTMEVDVQIGDVITGTSSIRGTGTIKISYNGSIKYNTSASGTLDDYSNKGISFTIN